MSRRPRFPGSTAGGLRRPGTPLGLLSLLLIAGTAIAPSFALGEERNPKAEAKVEVDKAQLHYKLGRFDEALAAYARAYEIFNAPALLFNIGQCHKNLKNYERAIFFFEGYLREETNPQKRALAEELITTSRAELQRQRYEPPTAAAAPALIPNKPPDTSPANSAIDTDTVLPPVDTGASSGVPVLIDSGASTPPEPITRKWWFWTAVGAAVIAIAGGAFAYYESGDTTTVAPSGSVGTLDGR